MHCDRSCPGPGCRCVYQEFGGLVVTVFVSRAHSCGVKTISVMEGQGFFPFLRAENGLYRSLSTAHICIQRHCLQGKTRASLKIASGYWRQVLGTVLGLVEGKSKMGESLVTLMKVLSQMALDKCMRPCFTLNDSRDCCFEYYESGFEHLSQLIVEVGLKVVVQHCSEKRGDGGKWGGASRVVGGMVFTG